VTVAAPEYRIDELARAAGTTVRNVRAYQDRGLLPPPRREGRVAWYSAAHLARLELVNQMLERGYSLANIGELVSAWERGHDLGRLLGLELALAGRWSNETPISVTAAELAQRFGVDGDALTTVLDIGIVEPDGDRYRVVSPRLLEAGAELVAAGVPVPAVLDLARRLHRDVDRIARRFVDLVSSNVFDEVGDQLPSADVPRLTEIVQRLRPIASAAVDAELMLAMERHVQVQLGDRLTRLAAERDAPAAS